MSEWRRLLAKAKQNPRAANRAVWALLRGWFYRAYYPLTGRRFKAGAFFRVEGRLSLRGPGRISFGDRVLVGESSRLWTYSSSAVIEVGSGSFLNGVHVWSQQRVAIGPRAILGRAEIMDTNFHSTHADRHRIDAPVRTAPVSIGENVWIGARAAILPGTSIGADSVVGYGAVCSGQLQGGRIYAGNPAREIKEVPRDPLPELRQGTVS